MIKIRYVLYISHIIAKIKNIDKGNVIILKLEVKNKFKKNNKTTDNQTSKDNWLDQI